MATYAYTFTSGDTVTPTKLNNARTVSEIVNADIKSDAAIAGTKVAPAFGAQDITVSGGARSITNTSDFALIFGTNNTERVRINNLGNVGIGATSVESGFKLHVAGNAYVSGTSGTTTKTVIDTADQRLVLGSYFESGVGQHAFIASTNNAETGNSALLFQTGTTERMRIDASGNMLLGTTSIGSATARVYVDSTEARIQSRNSTSGANGYVGPITTNEWRVYAVTNTPLTFGTNNDERMRITGGGDLYIGGTTAPSLSPRLGVHGYMVARTSPAADSPYVSHNAATSGDNAFMGFGTEASYTARGSIDYNRSAGVVRYNTTSDETLKNVIGDADPSRSLEILSQTKLKNFSWKDDPDSKVQIGVIAQELASVYAGAVSIGGETESGYRPWAVDKTAFTFHLIAGWQAHAKAIQELSAKVEALEAA
jgi:hypothetical protein